VFTSGGAEALLADPSVAAHSGNDTDIELRELWNKLSVTS
jgi:hypothetical protein